MKLKTQKRALARIAARAEVARTKSRTPDTVPASVQKLLTQRAAARAQEDWSASDLLRDKLVEAGFGVIDDTATNEQVLVLSKENKAKVRSRKDREAKAAEKLAKQAAAREARAAAAGTDGDAGADADADASDDDDDNDDVMVFGAGGAREGDEGDDSLAEPGLEDDLATMMKATKGPVHLGMGTLAPDTDMWKNERRDKKPAGKNGAGKKGGKKKFSKKGGKGR